MFFSKFSCAFLLAAAFVCVNAADESTAADEAPKCSYHHVANAGDSCDSIAYHTGTTVKNIKACNTWISSKCDNIVAGKNVLYPSTGLSKPNWTCGGSSYTVKKGDSCESIASTLDVEVGSIYFCNPINAGCTNIYAGQKLSIVFK